MKRGREGREKKEKRERRERKRTGQKRDYGTKDKNPNFYWEFGMSHGLSLACLIYGTGKMF